MLQVLREYTKDGFKITEYTTDGKTASHVVTSIISEGEIIQVESLEEKIGRLEQQLAEQKEQNLNLLDVNLSLYEELLSIKSSLNNA